MRGKKPIWTRETCIEAIRKFAEQKKRPPRQDEFRACNGLPAVPTAYRYVEVNKFDDLMEIATGEIPVEKAIQEFVWAKSCQGSKSVFFLNSMQISQQSGFSIRKIGAAMRKYNKPGVTVAEYQLESRAKGEGTRRTFIARHV